MNKFLVSLLMVSLSTFTIVTKAYAEDDHDHGHEHGTSEDHKEEHGGDGHGDEHDDEHDNEHSEDADHKDHKEEGEHNHAGNDEHEEEGGAKVGIDKGITEKGEQGFKLSKEATAAFGLKFDNYFGDESEFSKSAIVYIKNGQYVYRQRDQWIKRIPVKAVKLPNSKVKILGNDLKNNDQIITSGTGFIRGAELILSEGATHSH